MRRGVVMLEVIVGCGLVAVFLAICVQLLSTSALERRNTERRAIAMQEAANLIERVSAIPFDEISSETVNDVRLSPDVAQILPGATARLFVDEETGDVPAKRVGVEITATPAAGRTLPLARLTTWFYPSPQGATP